MTKVELIYDTDCPNVEQARRQLQLALTASGKPVQWIEWNRTSTESPPHVRRYGSPTILVNGNDVAGVAPSEGFKCCRVYRGKNGGLHGVPTIDMIATALGAKRTTKGSRSWLVSLPAVLVALLPSLTCPACWPAYAGLLSSLGLPFLNYTPLLTLLTVVALAAAVLALGLRANTRRGFGPLLVGILAAALVVLGKFVVQLSFAAYGGIGLLIAASVWNSWPIATPEKRTCPACALNSPTDIVIRH